MKVKEIEAAIAEGTAQVCPICKGEGEAFEGPEVNIDGMDCPTACAGCTVIYKFGSHAYGKVTELRFEEICLEEGLCTGCARELHSHKETVCGECTADAHADELYHMARDR